jgi:hypothetical protein
VTLELHFTYHKEEPWDTVFTVDQVQASLS